MSTIENMIPTKSDVIAMRRAADSAERTFNKMGLRVANAEARLRYFESELIVAKRNKANPLRVGEVILERDAARVERDIIEQQWNNQLDLHGELWVKYCAAHDLQAKAEAEAEAHIRALEAKDAEGRKQLPWAMRN